MNLGNLIVGLYRVTLGRKAVEPYRRNPHPDGDTVSVVDGCPMPLVELQSGFHARDSASSFLLLGDTSAPRLVPLPDIGKQHDTGAIVLFETHWMETQVGAVEAAGNCARVANHSCELNKGLWVLCDVGVLTVDYRYPDHELEPNISERQGELWHYRFGFSPGKGGLFLISEGKK